MAHGLLTMWTGDPADCYDRDVTVCVTVTSSFERPVVIFIVKVFVAPASAALYVST